jgi:hypothetical protein
MKIFHNMDEAGCSLGGKSSKSQIFHFLGKDRKPRRKNQLLASQMHYEIESTSLLRWIFLCVAAQMLVVYIMVLAVLAMIPRGLFGR